MHSVSSSAAGDVRCYISAGRSAIALRFELCGVAAVTFSPPRSPTRAIQQLTGFDVEQGGQLDFILGLM